MISEQRFFGNIFDVPGITPARLLLFAQDAVNRFRANDHSHRFAPETENMDVAAHTLQTELTDVSGSMATQKAATYTLDEVMMHFRETMQDENMDIAYKLGGPKTPAYMELYPRGKTEYSKVSKTQMPVLAKRVAQMAEKHAALLDEPLTDKLKSFAVKWENARDNQQEQKGTVDDNRAERSDSVLKLQLVVLAAAHAVAHAFPGDVNAGKAYFDFSLLDATRHPSLDRP